MSRIDWEWIVAFGLYEKKMVAFHFLKNETLLNFGPSIMKECKKCGSKYYADCLKCSFRNGGDVQDTEREQPDLIDIMRGLTLDPGFRLENALQWMRIQDPDQTEHWFYDP